MQKNTEVCEAMFALRVRFWRKGTTMARWARDCGYKPNSVDHTFRRNILRQAPPRGILARQIMEAAERFLADEDHHSKAS